MLLVLVFVEISMTMYMHVLGRGRRGEAAERKGERRQVSEHTQPKIWRWPPEGEGRARTLGGGWGTVSSHLTILY